MNLIRTTIRLPLSLKRAAEFEATKTNSTFQEIVQNALKTFIEQKHIKTAKKLTFKEIDLGEKVDNLSREDYYNTDIN